MTTWIVEFNDGAASQTYTDCTNGVATAGGVARIVGKYQGQQDEWIIPIWRISSIHH